jgi:hypothetical protein
MPGKKTKGLFVCVIAACVVAGCQSTSPSKYISPRVEGRVLDAQTRQPIDGVAVRRVVPYQEPRVDQARKGAEVMAQNPAVRSRKDGTFALESERALELFRRSGWYSVSLSFEQAGYFSFTTNYTIVHAIKTTAGEPLVQAGDILLLPRSE